jgi:hypothetical protein
VKRSIGDDPGLQSSQSEVLYFLAMAIPRQDAVAEVVLRDIETFNISFSIANAVVNCIHHFVITNSQRI